MPLEVLVVGGGSIGERHLRCFQKTEKCRVAVCESLDDRRQALQTTYDVEGFPDIDAAADRDWDLVIVATPAHLHVEHALRFRGRARALLIEKPLSTSLDGVDKLREMTREVLVGVGYVYRAHPAVQAAREVIRAGRFGEVREVTVFSGQHFPRYRPAYRETYYADRRQGGGAIQDAATHMVDLVRYLAGPMDRVFCDSGHQALPGVDVEDTVHISGRIPDGDIMVNISMNQFMAPHESFVQVNATKGSIRVNAHEDRFGTIAVGSDDWDWSERLLKERDEWFKRQARHMVDACEGRVPVLCTLEEAIHALKVNLAALASRGERSVLIDEVEANA